MMPQQKSPWVKNMKTGANTSVVNEVFARFKVASPVGCRFDEKVGSRMPCGVVFVADGVGFVVTTKSREDLDRKGDLFHPETNPTQEMTYVMNEMNAASNAPIYNSIFRLRMAMHSESNVLEAITRMSCKQFTSHTVSEAFAKVSSILGDLSGGRMVMFTFGIGR